MLLFFFKILRLRQAAHISGCRFSWTPEPGPPCRAASSLSAGGPSSGPEQRCPPVLLPRLCWCQSQEWSRRWRHETRWVSTHFDVTRRPDMVSPRRSFVWRHGSHVQYGPFPAAVSQRVPASPAAVGRAGDCIFLSVLQPIVAVTRGANHAKYTQHHN